MNQCAKLWVCIAIAAAALSLGGCPQAGLPAPSGDTSLDGDWVLATNADAANLQDVTIGTLRVENGAFVSLSNPGFLPQELAGLVSIPLDGSSLNAIIATVTGTSNFTRNGSTLAGGATIQVFPIVGPQLTFSFNLNGTLVDANTIEGTLTITQAEGLADFAAAVGQSLDCTLVRQ